MRILLVNKFYYPRGGDCMVTMGTERLLRAAGHDVAVFAMQYGQNVEPESMSAFASEVSFAGGVGAKVKALCRTMGGGDVKSSFTTMLHGFNPDVVHLHNIHSYLSPVIARLAHEHGCRVVWTMHDYKLVCPAYTCLHDGTPCTLCVTGNKRNVLESRCMKGSLVASAVAWIEAVKWNRKMLERYTDAFICPSEFMAHMMRKAGFDPGKIVVLNNFITHMPATAQQRGNYLCYVGRLSPEKGLDKVLEVVSRVNYVNFKVAGTGPLEVALRERYKSCSNIEFLGHLDSASVAQLLQGAHASVVPSQWYENNPLSVIESLCAGTPVLGSHMGGIPELINDSNGVIVDCYGNWENALIHIIKKPWDHEAIAREAQQRFAPETHYKRLMTIYSSK